MESTRRSFVQGLITTPVVALLTSGETQADTKTVVIPFDREEYDRVWPLDGYVRYPSYTEHVEALALNREYQKWKSQFPPVDDFGVVGFDIIKKDGSSWVLKERSPMLMIHGHHFTDDDLGRGVRSLEYADQVCQARNHFGSKWVSNTLCDNLHRPDKIDIMLRSFKPRIDRNDISHFLVTFPLTLAGHNRLV